MSDGALVQSLEAVAATMGDPAAAIYARLFERAPELEAFFVMDADYSVRGEMLRTVFDTLMDLDGGSTLAGQLLHAEYTNHCGMGIPQSAFLLFIDVMVDVFREALGPRWTGDFDAAWAQLRANIASLIQEQA